MEGIGGIVTRKKTKKSDCLRRNSLLADSLALKYTTDSLQAETHGDTLVIRFSQDVSLVALKDANGKFRVVGSHGLFAYPDSILKLAKSTGWYDVNLDDTLNAVRMTDNYFMVSGRKIKRF